MLPEQHNASDRNLSAVEERNWERMLQEFLLDVPLKMSNTTMVLEPTSPSPSQIISLFMYEAENDTDRLDRLPLGGYYVEQ
ncbi:hypothetical protein ANCCAN_08070 [Ancylostoma caninum]|uniref:Uncharacterized protein n=1 Tax=Ancylostoma caninum TaxID=29170 RepID=A0A368GSE3_ANCCA|nr:hypothetical protein ANCCAN_08070 [Ancylostoma caninum]